ncbi:MAG TPA: YbhB/YbcL family Raf kinase inhibitor-like protein [Candidatus Saccharimonadales bacterium]|nr:YbhB/YbcL family Raf kinase inhibitor-like protein [Candidatus Saccharimonadales bacterium]
MHLTSPAFQNNDDIPIRYGRKFDDINPPLEFSEIPPDAESLVLIMDDPDAPGGVFTHWVIFNIPPAATHLGEDEIPAEAVEGINDYGRKGYGGPKPPNGTHRYVFKLYALDALLELQPEVNSEDLYEAMEGHVITKAKLTGLYSADES